MLGSVALLYCAFVVVQFQYFFGGQANISVQGYTYAEYARRGFGELMAVAIFSLLMLMGLGTVSRRETTLQQRLFSVLGVIILALVGVMLVSAYQRLGLYEMAYGFSRRADLRARGADLDRDSCLRPSLCWNSCIASGCSPPAALIASLGFVISLGLLNVDGFIVRQNVDRAVRGESLDVPYLVSLSTDSVPPLQAIFESPSYPGLTRDAVGAVLACRQRSPPSAVGTRTGGRSPSRNGGPGTRWTPWTPSLAGIASPTRSRPLASSRRAACSMNAGIPIEGGIVPLYSRTINGLKSVLRS